MGVALFARFPGLRAPTGSGPVVPLDRRADYPELAADLEDLDREVAPHFERYDRSALRQQLWYRRMQLLVLLGSALITGLGALQAALPGQRWPGVLLAVAGVVVVASTRLADERELFTGYLTDRLRAERLRALHFRYLAATGRFARGDRRAQLRRAVLAIEAGREPE